MRLLLRAVAVLFPAVLVGCGGAQSAPELGAVLTSVSSPQTLAPVKPASGLVPCTGLPTPRVADAPWQQLVFDCLADGRQVSGSQLRGRATVAVVWASWCGPCRAELPVLADFARRQSAVRVIGIGWKDQPRALQAYAREAAMPFPTIVDREARIEAVLSIHSQPTLLFIDASGAITHIERGTAGSVARLRALVAEHL